MLRSNYFAVKDEESFRRFCRRWGLKLIGDTEGRFGFLDAESKHFQSHEDRGEYFLGWRGDRDDEDLDDGDDEGPIEPHESASFPEQLAALLAYDNVAVVVEVDHDRMRYLTGTAWAVNSRNETKDLALEDIYEVAAGLGQYVTRAEY